MNEVIQLRMARIFSKAGRTFQSVVCEPREACALTDLNSEPAYEKMAGPISVSSGIAGLISPPWWDLEATLPTWTHSRRRS